MKLHERALFRFGEWIGILICEPQLRLGRRRHDNHCDQCGELIQDYAAERLSFPDEPESESTLEKMHRMSNAEYVRYCIDCSVELEDSDQR